eukprot:4463810-Amphidinium_carterae.1
MDGSAHLQHALQRAWRAWHSIRPQACNLKTSVKARLRLVDSVVGSSLLHGLHTRWFCGDHLWQIERFQLGVLRQCLQCKRRERETWLTWLQRATRSARSLRSSTGLQPWVVQLHLRAHSWAGHVAREASMCKTVLTSRDLRWWQGIQTLNITLPRQSQLRHPARFAPKRWESMLGSDWQPLALDRDGWRALALPAALAHLTASGMHAVVQGTAVTSCLRHGRGSPHQPTMSVTFDGPSDG